MRKSDLLLRLQQRSQLHRLWLKAPYILAAILVGLISVGFGLLIDRITELSAFILQAHPLVVFLLTPLVFVLGRVIVQVLGTPAAGSGIPQVMAALRWKGEPQPLVDRLLNLKVLLAKILSSSVALLGGGLIGREGPMVQIGAIVFLAIGRSFRRFMPKVDDYSLIVAGGAAGVAAAFNTPLGGIVFAIEELIDQHFAKVRSVLIVGVIIAGMMAQSLLGPYLFFGSVKLGDPDYHLLAPMFCISVGLGALGGIFGKLLIKAQTRLAALTSPQRLLWAGACGIVVAMGLVLMRSEAPHAVGGGTRLIRDILWHNAQVSPALLVERYCGTILSFLSGCAAGIFAPALAFGAAFGKAAASLLGSSDPIALTLIGMVSFLAAVTRAPFTAMVLVMEMSNGHGVALQCLLASLLAVGVARVMEPEAYYHFQSQFFLNQVQDQVTEPEPEPLSQHY